MKAEAQATDDGKLKQSRGAKVQSPKTIKAPSRKAKSSRSNAKRGAKHAGDERGFMARGKEALDQLPKWANRAADALPQNIRNIELPNSAPVQNYLKEKPLVLGAIGLGLGAILGTFLPTFRSEPTTRRRK